MTVSARSHLGPSWHAVVQVTGDRDETHLVSLHRARSRGIAAEHGAPCVWPGIDDDQGLP